MKTQRQCCFIIPFVLVFAGAAMALDFVDIGNPASEVGHGMVSWGPVEPLTSGGTFGGIDDCRAIWSVSDGTTSAFINLNFQNTSEGLYFKHLEGIADDGFEVYIGTNKVYTHTEATTTEQWQISACFPAIAGGIHTVELRATGAQWASFNSFGQVCFAEIWVGNQIPVPLDQGTWDEVKALYR